MYISTRVGTEGTKNLGSLPIKLNYGCTRVNIEGSADDPSTAFVKSVLKVQLPFFMPEKDNMTGSESIL